MSTLGNFGTKALTLAMAGSARERMLHWVIVRSANAKWRQSAHWHLALQAATAREFKIVELN
jgi:hypothetical protein